MNPILANLRSQKGLTIIEQVMTLFVIGLVVLAWVNAYRYITRGVVGSKHNMRAQNLALSRLEEAKNLAMTMSMGGAFSTLTQSANPLTELYGTTRTSSYDGRTFTWRVLAQYAGLSSTSSAPSVQASSTTAHGILLTSEVYWSEITPKGVIIPLAVTMTGYVTHARQ